MAYTEAQLESVEAAIILIAAGAQEVEIMGKRVKKPDLNSLTKLRNEMKAELQNSSDGGIIKPTFKNRENI